MVFVTAHATCTLIDGLGDNTGYADMAVVFGNTVHPDGTLSRRLEERVGKALEMYENGRIGMIFVSGALGSEGYCEAEKMKEYLLSKGIPESVVTTDNEGRNTEATVDNAITYAETHGIKSIVAVSQYYHITRIKLLFRKKGFDKISGAAPRYFELRDIYSLTREFPAFYYSLLVR